MARFLKIEAASGVLLLVATVVAFVIANTGLSGASRLWETQAGFRLGQVELTRSCAASWSGFVIMPVFALANAGVEISRSDLASPVAGAVFAGLVFGKPVGVIVMTWLSVRIGVATRPQGLGWSTIAAGSLLTGIGFTMSLFIAGLAFPAETLAAAKLGILSASIVAGSLGLLALLRLTAGGPRERT